MSGPSLTEAEITELLPILREQASWHGRGVIACKMDQDDFIQQGFLGILTMNARPYNTAQHQLSCRILAAKQEMIEGIRRFHNTRPRHRKQIEWLMPDYDHLAKCMLVDEEFEDRTIAAIDLQRFVTVLARVLEQLPPREQSILRERLQGKTLTEVGEQFHFSEARACQIEKTIVTKLRAQYQEAA